MRTDEIEIRGRLIQVLLENTFHFNLFIRYIYIYINILELLKLKNLRLIVKSLIKWKKKKITQSC